ncbi:hypothetical protein ACM9VO_03040 [Legionella pneumophila]|uniref:hypothetical protein n=1 Tax=Legionella pneumophila TaxID=446 RepID=UPI003A4C557F
MDSLDLDFYAITRAFLFFSLIGFIVFLEISLVFIVWVKQGLEGEESAIGIWVSLTL